MRLLFFSCIFIIPLFAQGLSLTDAIRLLKENNLEVEAAEYALQSAELSYDMANAHDYGQLDFTQDIMRSNDAGNVFGFKLASREAAFEDFGLAQFNPANPNILQVQPEDLNYPDDHNFFQSTLRYELPLYTGYKLTSYQAMMKQMREIALLDKEEKINTKIFETRKAYFDMALLVASLNNLHAILENIKKLETMTQEMITEGYAKKIDLLEVQSKKTNLLRIISELDANKELLYHYLSFLLNQEVTQIEIPDKELSEPDISTEAILAQNIDIQKTIHALNIAEEKITLENSRYLPVIGAVAQVQTADDSFLGDVSDHSSYNVGIRLRWNLFNGGGDSTAIEQARVESLKMQTQTELAKKGIALKVKEIQTKIKTSDAKIRHLNVELTLAREIYKNYENRYKEQLSSMNDVIIKQSDWLEKVLELLKAENSRNTQIFALERLGNLTQGDTL